ncbi:SpoIIE family protein phosphatase [bacterium]|nr:SpoIIE family protein phosphatase [bacterium]
MWELVAYFNLGVCLILLFYIYYLLSYRRVAVENAFSSSLPFITTHQLRLLFIGFLFWESALLLELIQIHHNTWLPPMFRLEIAYYLFITRPVFLTCATLYLTSALLDVAYWIKFASPKSHQKTRIFRRAALCLIIPLWIYSATYTPFQQTAPIHFMTLQQAYIIIHWLALLILLISFPRKAHLLQSEIYILIFVWAIDFPLELGRCFENSLMQSDILWIWKAAETSEASKAAILTTLTLALFFLILLRTHFYFSRIAFQEAKRLLDEKKIHQVFSKSMLAVDEESRDRNALSLDSMPDRIFQTLLQLGMEITRADAGAIFVHNNIRQLIYDPDFEVKKGAFFKAHTLQGLYPPQLDVSHLSNQELTEENLHGLVQTEHVTPGQDILGIIAETGHVECIPEALNDPRIRQQDIKELQIQSQLIVPIMLYNRPLAVVSLIHNQEANTFTDEDEALMKVVAEQASYPLRDLCFHHQLEENKQMEVEMELAREVHRTLLPPKSPIISGYDISSTSYSAQIVGGDYYDFIHLDNDTVAIAIADVSGKGIAGALTMATIRSALRSHVSLQKSPKEILMDLNRFLIPDMKPGTFVSMQLAILTLSTGKLTLARAGHDPLIHIARDSNTCRKIMPDGIVLGVVNGALFDRALQQTEITVAPGDTIVLYTDGIPETMNRALQEFSLDRFITVLQTHHKEAAQTLLHSVYEELDTFAGNQPPQDDQTLIIMKRVASPNRLEN